VLFLHGKMRPAFSGNYEWWLRAAPFLCREDVVIAGFMGFGMPGAPRESIEHGIPHFRGRILPLHEHLREVAFWLDISRYMLRHRRDFDVLFDCMPGNDSGRLAILTARLLGKRVVVESTLEGADDPRVIRQRAAGRLRLHLVASADAHISISPGITAIYRAVLPHLDVHEIERGCDVSVYRPASPAAKAAARGQLGLPIDRRIACFVGSLMQRKGADILIEAWRDVVAKLGDRVLLLCVGPTEFSGDEPAEVSRRNAFAQGLMATVKDSGLSSSIAFTGRTSAVPDYLRASDIFVLPSRAEGWPNALVEALATGLPSVLSPLGGVAHTVADAGVTIVESELPGDYARAVTGLLEDDALCARLGETARSVALQRYSLESRAIRYSAIFHDLVTRDGSARHDVHA
jgi:glycosyltransferase involved in cell wall biosynthesis